MTQPPLDTITDDCRPNRLAHHEPDRRVTGPTRNTALTKNTSLTENEVGNERRASRTLARADCLSKLLTVAHAIPACEQNSGRKLRTATTATRSENGTAGAGAHTKTEAVLFTATTDVRLVSTFRHELSSCSRKCAVLSTTTARPQTMRFMGTRQSSLKTIQRYGGRSRRSN